MDNLNINVLRISQDVNLSINCSVKIFNVDVLKLGSYILKLLG